MSSPSFTNTFTGGTPGGASGAGYGSGEDGLPDTKSESFDSAVDGDIVAGDTQYKTSFVPTSGKVDSIFNLAGANKQHSNLHWNWDYDANCTRNPEFTYMFPGGEGWLKLYKPYLKAHVGLTLNFTSDLAQNMVGKPHVTINGELDGNANMNIDAATRLDFTQDAKMSPLNRVQLPIATLGKLGQSTMYMKPIKFFFGTTPMSIDPGFSCHVNIYHVGALEGSLRVSLKTNLTIKGLMNFDSETGLTANMSATAKDVQFTPPTWMVFTKHCEIGVTLEPEVWVKGDMGSFKNLKMGWAMRPFVNVSIMQKGYEVPREAAIGALPTTMMTAQAPVGVNMKQLVIFPYRASGLAVGQKYFVEVKANGITHKTAVRMSLNGIIDYDSSIDGFKFGSISEASMSTDSISVTVRQAPTNNSVGTGSTTCTQMSSGECNGGSTQEPFTVSVSGGITVFLSTAWNNDPVTYMLDKVKGVSFHLPMLSKLSNSVATQAMKNGSTVEFRMMRNGRAYNLPMYPVVNKPKGGTSTVTLKSNATYDMGLRFLDAWKGTGVAADEPQLSLYINDKQVGKCPMPTIQWAKDKGMINKYGVAMTAMATMYGSTTTQQFPLSIALQDPNGNGLAALGEFTVTVDEITDSSYWILPYQATTVYKGEKEQLYWTTASPSGMAGSIFGGGDKMSFTLTALEVGSGGGLTPTAWSQKFQAGCSANAPASIHTYNKGAIACISGYAFTPPPALYGKTVLLCMTWADKNGNHHRLLSAAVTYSSETKPTSSTARRLQWSGQQSAAPGSHRLSFGNSNSQSSQQDFAQHVSLNGAKCNAAPLEYSVGYGVLAKEDIQGNQKLTAMMEMFKTMGGMSMMMAAQNNVQPSPGAPATPFGITRPTPTYPGVTTPAPGEAATSSFTASNPLMAMLGMGGGAGATQTTQNGNLMTEYTPILAQNMNDSLAGLLPNAICSGGACKGEMPGCRKEAVKPINIKQIVFKMSREFKIDDFITDPMMKEALAYGLATVPEAIEVGQEEVQEEAAANGGPTSAPTPTPTHAPTVKGQAPQVVQMKFTIQGLDFTGLSTQSNNAIKQVVASTMGSSIDGVGASDVNVALSPGSVNVSATITTATSNNLAMMIQAHCSTLPVSMTSAINRLTGLTRTGTISITGLCSGIVAAAKKQGATNALTGSPKCWLRMPTGCSKALSETTTPTQWFAVDTSPSSAATCTTKISAFNTWCGKTDAESQWAASPTEAVTSPAPTLSPTAAALTPAPKQASMTVIPTTRPSAAPTPPPTHAPTSLPTGIPTLPTAAPTNFNGYQPPVELPPSMSSSQQNAVDAAAKDGQATPLSFGASPAAQAAMAASGQSSGLNRRLGQKHGKKTRYSDTIVVTIKKLNYNFDEAFIQKLVDQGSFDLLSDGREKTHGPVKITSFYLRDNPKYHPYAAFMPWVAGGLACALLALAVPLYIRLRRRGYTKVREEDDLLLADDA
jgi:hypothetical protein